MTLQREPGNRNLAVLLQAALQALLTLLENSVVGKVRVGIIALHRLPNLRVICEAHGLARFGQTELSQ